MFAVTILGNNSAVPAFDRHPTSQVVSLNGHSFLVDCGEGTQIQMSKYKIRRSKISHIFISHLHGDHYFGLIGLLNSFSLLGRQQPLHIFAPAFLEEIIRLQLKVADAQLCFPIHFSILQKEGTLVDTDDFQVSCFPTEHRIECYGFSFTEKLPPRKIDAEKARAAGIPGQAMDALKNGADYIDADGRIIENHTVTIANHPPKKYVYCADTRYTESFLHHIKGADLIYHETTYMDSFRDRAIERFHSTTIQAGTLAAKAGVKKLLIGHFSSKYDTLTELETETKTVFPATQIATEGQTFIL